MLLSAVRRSSLAMSARFSLSAGASKPTVPRRSTHWVYAGDAGKLLREYLAARYGLDLDPDRGTGEVFLAGAAQKPTN